MINSELDDNPLTLEEQMVASTVASLRDNIGNNKRTRMDYHCQDDDQDQDRGMTANEPAAKKRVIESEAEVDDDPSANDDNAFQDYPYFGYRDYSQEPDPDPLIPLTAPGRVPNFPAKMHVILSQPELQDIVAWLPHGRSWRVLRPREFEVKVLPTYFDHGKFSSFIRQANGWGFRRITQGKERNSYYHPRFLRGLPHLAKTMKRPGVNEKTTLHPSKQPDLYKISKRLPLLLGGDSDSDSDSDQFNNMRRGVDESTLLLKCALEGGGPKTRMPIYTALSLMQQPHCIIMSPLTPKDESCLNNFGKSILASEAMFAYGQRRPGRASPPLVQDNLLSWTTNLPKSSPLLSSSYVGDHNKNGSGRSGISATANATHWTRNNTLLFPTTITNTSSSCNTSATSTATHNGIHIRSLSSVLAVANELALLDRRQQQQQQQHPASSAFAAGFAAATAFSQQHFHDVLDQLSRQQQNGK